jgi:hypothetical protein
MLRVPLAIAYLNETKPAPDLILLAAQYVANRWADYRPGEELQKELVDRATDNKRTLLSGLDELAASPELLERTALRSGPFVRQPGQFRPANR